MKKILFCMMAIIAAITITSCGNTADDAAKIAEKIQNNETLEASDYTAMIKYVGAYAEKLQDAAVNGTDAQLNEEVTQLNAEYPYAELFRSCIAKTPITQFSDEDMKLIEKYAGYVEFTAPDGTQIQTDPNAAGLEEATPDTLNGVDAGAVDTVKVEEKGF